MMVRLLRSSKWELILFFFFAAALSSLIWYVGTDMLSARAGLEAERVRMTVPLILILLNLALGYWAAQRWQRRIDTMHLALKQAANGNLSVRIPEEGARSFTAAFHEFNTMVAAMQRRMQLLQRIGEEQVMREAASNEEAVMEERKRLARDLHDTVSQQLFAIHMSASSLPKLLAMNSDRAEQLMEQLIEMSSSAQKQMRGFIAQLRPMELEGKSLQQALDKWFPDYCRQNHLQGVLDWRIEEPLSEAKEHQFFLIIQEALANIVKHASASKATLTLSETEHQLILTVQDDGAGFRVDQVKRGSYGLSTMSERAQRLGGDAEIISKTGGGTRVRVSIPKYTPKEHEDDE